MKDKYLKNAASSNKISSILSGLLFIAYGCTMWTWTPALLIGYVLLGITLIMRNKKLVIASSTILLIGTIYYYILHTTYTGFIPNSNLLIVYAYRCFMPMITIVLFALITFRKKEYRPWVVYALGLSATCLHALVGGYLIGYYFVFFDAAFEAIPYMLMMLSVYFDLLIEKSNLQVEKKNEEFNNFIENNMDDSFLD